MNLNYTMWEQSLVLLCKVLWNFTKNMVFRWEKAQYLYHACALKRYRSIKMREYEKMKGHKSMKTSGPTPIESKKRKANSTVETPRWNFEVEYNDHFETPKEAYEHILPVLRVLAQDLGKPLEDLIIYDPYYCDGRVVGLLTSLGFRNVINNNRDFYVDISTQSIPGIYSMVIEILKFYVFYQITIS